MTAPSTSFAPSVYGGSSWMKRSPSSEIGCRHRPDVRGVVALGVHRHGRPRRGRPRALIARTSPPATPRMRTSDPSNRLLVRGRSPCTASPRRRPRTRPAATPGQQQRPTSGAQREHQVASAASASASSSARGPASRPRRGSTTATVPSARRQDRRQPGDCRDRQPRELRHGPGSGGRRRRRGTCPAVLLLAAARVRAEHRVQLLVDQPAAPDEHVDADRSGGRSRRRGPS